MSKLRVLLFTSPTCSACNALKNGAALPILKADPDIELVTLVIQNKEGKAPNGTHYGAAYDLSDDYDVQSLPGLVFETGDGVRLFIEEGNQSRKMMKEAMERAHAEADAIAEGTTKPKKNELEQAAKRRERVNAYSAMPKV
jgi:hypothetical protein